jgi:DMSO/TMAO reductase YedYZ molybdopterin-dependent catalytic subunit
MAEHVPVTPASGGLSRRGFLTTVGAAAGVVTLATAGATVGPLRRLSPLATRRATVGPQDLPVNKSGAAARVTETAVDPAYRLLVGAMSLSLFELQSLPQHDAVLPIACVEGWSAIGHWRGVRLRDLLDRAGIGRDRWVRVESLERAGLYRSSEVSPTYARDPLTLLALRLGGEPLALDHGYPCRLIAPNRPGVLQTKWVQRIVAT